jgi:hypothetical protein
VSNYGEGVFGWRMNDNDVVLEGGSSREGQPAFQLVNLVDVTQARFEPEPFLNDLAEKVVVFNADQTALAVAGMAPDEADKRWAISIYLIAEDGITWRLGRRLTDSDNLTQVTAMAFSGTDRLLIGTTGPDISAYNWQLGTREWRHHVPVKRLGTAIQRIEPRAEGVAVMTERELQLLTRGSGTSLTGVYEFPSRCKVEDDDDVSHVSVIEADAAVIAIGRCRLHRQSPLPNDRVTAAIQSMEFVTGFSSRDGRSELRRLPNAKVRPAQSGPTH